MITRREFSKLGLGVAAFSAGTQTIFSANNKSGESSSSAIPPKEWAGGRRVGIRANGSYWGGGCEQIDMLSGNLNFSLPLVLTVSRGAIAKVVCSYNSQLWETSGSKEQNYGIDSGFGYGWRVQIGSIVPQFSRTGVSGYTYINETGAEYPLSPSSGVWVSLQGLFISYNPTGKRLQFPDGTFWIMGCESAGGEPDAGALYPTLIQDRNGNQIIISYMTGAGSNKKNSSTRIVEITDARAVDSESGRKTYSFIYGTGNTPSLFAITSHIGNSESWSFSYETQRLVSPFKASDDYGFVSILKSIQTAAGFDYVFNYNAYGELHYAQMPYGARFRWEYADIRSGTRGVVERGLMLSPNAKEAIYDIKLSQKAETTYTTLTEPDGMATRIWTFNSDGLLNTIDERTIRANKSLHRTTHIWKSTIAGVPYIGTAVTTLDADTPDEKSSRDEFDRDLFGNITESRKFDYDNKAKPISIVRNTYLTDPAYIDRGIYKLLLATTVSNGEETVEQVRNQYDTTPLVDKRSLSEHDPKYDASWTVRGNLTENITGEIYTRMQFDITGLIDSQEDGVGYQIAYLRESNNTGIAQTIPNQNMALGAKTILDAALQPVSIMLPAGGKIETRFDGIGRTVSTTAADGGKRSYTYEGNAVIEIADKKYKKTVYDDFQRLCIVEEGAIDDDRTISIVEYEYGAVPGSPLGACLRASIPHAPGAKPAWISYEYDALGRFAASDKAGHGGKETYVYKGNDTTVVNARGGWKTFTHDAKWQLRKITTPDTNGKGKNETLYQYDTLGKLKSATLPRPEGTQKHSFKYNGGGRLLTGNRAESGREDMTYNTDGMLASRTDAKGQRTAYLYDSFKRLVSVKRFDASGQVKPEECVSYYYDHNPFDTVFSQNVDGRLVAAQWGDMKTGPGLLTEMYSYTVSGRMTQKRLRVNRGHGSTDLDLGYSYDNEGRIAAISYPNGGPVLNYSYDAMGRQSLLTTATDVLVKDVSYSAQGHLTSFSQLIPGTSEYLTETHDIGSTCHTNSVVAKAEKAALPLVNIEYKYYEDGKLESDTDRISGEEIRYEYDSAGRLKTAKSQNRNWELGYDYDGFGNLSSHKRRNRGRKGKDFDLKHNPATNRMETPSVEYDANGNIVSLAGMKLMFDIENRLIELRHEGKGVERYAYDPGNRRIWKKQPNDVEEFYMYGEDGKLLAVYELIESRKDVPEFALVDYSVYFAKRLIRSRDNAVVLNRQHSVETEVVGHNINRRTKYLPFGEEDYITEENRVKFGTYRRDATSGLDYAEQRYYSSELGRFINPDPYVKSIKLDDPETWNRYTYCCNDPINRIDPHGTFDICSITNAGCGNYNCPGLTGSGYTGSCEAYGGWMSVWEPYPQVTIIDSSYWDNWDWRDWTSLAFAVVGTGITVAGLFITIPVWLTVVGVVAGVGGIIMVFVNA